MSIQGNIFEVVGGVLSGIGLFSKFQQSPNLSKICKWIDEK
jgi:hypothetical protein